MTKDKRARRQARIEAGTWPLCEVEGCDKPVDRTRLCAMHRNRVRRHGDTSVARGYWPRGSWQDAVSTRYEVDEHGCWLWTGPIGTGGYGWVHVEGDTIGAHRASYLLHKGPIVDGLYVCHTCDVRRCINPAHLWLGSHAENMRDMADKGRGRKAHIDARKGE